MATQSMAQQAWKKFELREIEQKRSELGREYLPFLNEQSFRMGLYVLKAKSIDSQPVHDEDEVYYVTSGKAKIVAGDSTFDAIKGSVIFVKAGVEHKFVEIEEDLSALVIFSNSPTQPGDPDAMAWHINNLRKEGKPDENVWNQFLYVSTLRTGLYLLPETLNGDKPLTHKVDEINIVTKGNATFVVGEERVTVQPGSIVWVSQNNPHFFEELSEDFDVLITFHIKP